MDIILIGMPGCGKTTIGRRTAEMLDREFVDIDEKIEETENRKISEIFSCDGEEYFRRCETKCLREELGRDRVISTGGGIVTVDKNIEILKDSESVVIFIDRPTEKIAEDVNTSTRPLLKDGKERLIKLYEERYDKYNDVCDIKILNTGTQGDAVSKIVYEVTWYENNGN